MSGLYFPILVLWVCGLAMGLGMIALSALLGRRQPTLAKDTPYESGIDPKEDARQQFPVKFSLTALVFLVFDVEIAFLFPWAVIFRSGLAEGRGPFLMAEMATFSALLAVALLYTVRRRGLEWE